MKRLRIIMDEKREIMPDYCENYVIGVWDRTLENAVENSISYGRSILVIRPEGVDLTCDKVWRQRHNMTSDDDKERSNL